TWRARVRGLPIAGPLQRLVGPFESINGYGAFAVMTKTRPEILLDGSADGVTWKPYEFKWKPGAVDRRPEFIAPLQPRIDWQMWFAALGSCDDNPWFVSLLKALLENRPEVTRELAINPFPDSAPKYLRSRIWQYRFSDWSEKRETGAWWQRTEQGP